MKKPKRISILEPGTLILGVLLSILSAAICMQIMGQLGTAPNTSLIGAVLVMIIARIPLAVAQKFRNLERQNYVLSIASSAGFSAANCGFVAIATMFILGRHDMIVPIALGTLVGCMIAVFVMGRIFDSKIFPAQGPWPMGQAVVSVVEAGDSGGKKGFELLQGLVVGAIAGFFGVPMAGVGIAFVANMVTMTALGVGIIVRGYGPRVFGGFDIGQTNIAQGLMIGAGAVALVQIIITISKSSSSKSSKHKSAPHHVEDGNKTTPAGGDAPYTVSDAATQRTLVGSVGLFAAGGIALALLTGIFSDMTPLMSVVWVIFAGVVSVVVMVLVGTASMHSGWAPGFAVITIFLTLGMLIGFPAIPLAVLIGYVGAVGMPMHDTGIGLKAGWLLRGKGADPAAEAYGRRQQVLIKQIGVVVGILMAMIFGLVLIRGDVIPPMSIFYAATIGEAVNPALLRELAMWAVPGAVLQAAFGNKSVGLMVATGLLINNPIFGVTLLVAIALRKVIGVKHMSIRAPGLIAGDGLFGFVSNIVRAFF
ncbi:MAG: OPT/YSL family transporter [Defluviitaleaceae bacterium]|nr:OPT/YSL family transporter [Defluviitaleaceae bacterium]